MFCIFNGEGIEVDGLVFFCAEFDDMREGPELIGQALSEQVLVRNRRHLL
jgi:hypothetical protein